MEALPQSNKGNKGRSDTNVPRTHQNEDLKAAEQARLAAYLQIKGQRLSVEREALFDTVLAYERTFSASELYEKAKEASCPVTLATVYNALELFVKAGVVIPFEIQRRETYYLPYFCSYNRAVVVCSECGKTVYLRRVKVYDILAKLITPHFSKSRPLLLYYGYCKDCRFALRQAAKKRNNKTLE